MRAYAHARGVVHHDLKPSNVMVGTFGEVQVMDWRLAKVLPQEGTADDARMQPAPGESVRTIRGSPGGAAMASQSGQVLGTPAYMAPEQARGEVDRVDERAYVFGLGAILCEILTGAPPHTGATAAEVCRNAGAGWLDPALARLAAAAADPELAAIARRCLHAERRERARDASVVAREVTSYLLAVEGRARAAEVAAAGRQPWSGWCCPVPQDTGSSPWSGGIAPWQRA